MQIVYIIYGYITIGYGQKHLHLLISVYDLYHFIIVTFYVIIVNQIMNLIVKLIISIKYNYLSLSKQKYIIICIFENFIIVIWFTLV